MPLIPKILEQNIKSALADSLKSVSPKPKGAGADYDKAIEKQAEAIAKGLATVITDYIKGALIIAPPGAGGGPCTIA